MNMHIKNTRHGRLILWALWTSGICAVCLTLAGIVLPHVIRPILEKRISQTLGSACRIESLSFNPFTLTLAASNITVPYPGDAGMFLRLGVLEVVPSFSSLLRLTPGIKELKLDSPVIDLTLFENGTFSPNLFFDGQETNEPSGAAVFPCVIHNFSIRNGTVAFHDQAKNSTHIVENITLTVPFTSTLPADRERAVTPQLNATVNGRPLALAGETRPFSKSLLTEFTLQAEELELDRFRKYLAPHTTLEIKSGALSTSLKLRIYREEGETIRFVLVGNAEVRKLELVGPLGTAFTTAYARVELDKMQPGMQRIVVNDILLDSPVLTVRRAADGSVDWQAFFTRSGQDENAASPMAFVVAGAEIRDGSIRWHDAAVPGPDPYTIQHIQAILANFDSKGDGKADFSLAFGEDHAKFTAAGKVLANPLRIEGSMNMERMPLTPFAGYLSQAGISLDGVLGLKGDFFVEHGTRTCIRLGEIKLYNASLAFPGAAPLLAAGSLAANDIMADLSARNVAIGRVSGSGINAWPVRGKDGNIVFGASAKKTTPPSAGWQAAIGNLQLDATNITLTDHSVRGTAVLPFSDLRVSASALSTQPGGQWTADVSAKPGKHGALRLEAKGTFSPLSVSFRARADRADIVFLSPYVREAANLSLSEGLLNADVNGQLRTGRQSGKIRVDLSGDAGLHGISLTEDRREIIGWGRLRLEKFRYRNMSRSSGALSAENLILNGPRVSVILGEDGTTNLQRMLSRPQKDDMASKMVPAHEPVAGPVGGFSSLSLGGIRITSGEIRLRDEGLQPPELHRMERLRIDMDKVSSDPASRGEFEGSFRLGGSPVILEGKINPLVTPFAGDLTVDVRDLDLTAFSRYAAKFTGYPIRRGELSARVELSLNGFDVRGHNELVLGKLDLGDKDPSSDAPDMPIKAAIGLLRDLSGDISLSLPVSGRLDDPQFHIGGVMGKTVINTMLKTAAVPVTLIRGFFSIFVPKIQQERITFAPGEDRITRRMSESLRALAESLSTRGRVRLELIGAADMREKTDMTMAAVMKEMRKIQYDALPEAERAATSPDRMRVGMHVDAQEYARLLREVYMSWPAVPAGDMPKSAREMMRALRGSITISDEQVNELAQARARAVRDELVRIDASLDRRVTFGPSRITAADNEGRRNNSSVLIIIK